MTVIVRPARDGDASTLQKVMNDAKNLKWLGGFTFEAEIQGRIDKQSQSGAVTLVTVEKDGVPVSSSEITPKDHYMKMGLVAVATDYRDFDPVEKGSPESKRQGYGSYSYACHAVRSALEGRTFLLDQIHWQNDVMKKYLGHHNFESKLEQVQRVRNFCTLYLLQYDLVEKGIDHWLGVIEKGREKGVEFEINDCQTYQKAFEKNTERYKALGLKDLVGPVIRNRELALEAIR